VPPQYLSWRAPPPLQCRTFMRREWNHVPCECRVRLSYTFNRIERGDCCAAQTGRKTASAARPGLWKQARHRRFRVSNFAQTPSRRASRAVEKLLGSNLGDSNAANFVRSTKVRIFRYDSRNPDRYDGIMLGFRPHLDNSVNDWSGSNIATRLSSKK
jgi:hypothetical protein